VREYGCCSMSTTRTMIELTAAAAAAAIERLCARAGSFF
jgi:Arc/MetJ family transcription regulator